MSGYTSDTVRTILAQMGFDSVPDDELREVAARLDALLAELRRLDDHDLTATEPWPGLLAVIPDHA